MTTPPTAFRLPPWAPFVVLAVAIMAQSGALRGTWLLDDAAIIRDNVDVARGPAGIPRLVADGRLRGEFDQGAYRPLMLASFALEAPLWRTEAGDFDSLGFHVTNLLLFALAAWLLLSVLTRTLPGRPGLALGAALVFAVHPLNSGTVTALLGRADLLALVLSLGALRIWVGRPRLGPVEMIWVALLWFLALLAHEGALCLPLVFVAVDLARARGQRASSARRMAYAGLIPILALYLVLWPGVGAGQADLPTQSVGASAALGLEGALRMALRFVLPVGYRGDYSDEASATAGYTLEGPAGAAAVLAILLLLVAAGVLWKRRRSGLALAWLLCAGISVIAAAVQPTGRALELRFATLAGLPLFLAAGAAAEVLVRFARGARWRMGAAAATAVFGLVSLGGLAQVEAAAWQDDAAYYARLLRESPGHIRALVRQGRLERRRAARLADRASRMSVEDAAGRPNAELARLRRERAEALARAEGWLRRAQSLPRGEQMPSVWAERAYLRLASGEAALALRALRQAKRFDPILRGGPDAPAAREDGRARAAAAEIYFAEGTCRRALGDVERAAAAFQSALGLVPDDSAYLRAAAMALMDQRRWAEGLPLLERARKHATSSHERGELEALLVAQRQRAREMAAALYRSAEEAFAAQHFELALERYQATFLADPRFVDAYIKAAYLVGSYMGNYGRAQKYLLEAERIARSEGVANDAVLRKIRKQRDFLNNRKREDDLDR